MNLDTEIEELRKLIKWIAQTVENDCDRLDCLNVRVSQLERKFLKEVQYEKNECRRDFK